MSDFHNSAQEVKERLDLVEFISKYVKLRKVGKNWSGNCPFHSEKSPSFMVNPEIHRYKCYGCGKGGDIFNFLQEIERIEFVEALEILAKEAGVELQKVKVDDKIAILQNINEEATSFFQTELAKNPRCLEYCKNRGFSKESIEKFRIGYSPGKGILLKHLSGKGFSTLALKEVGLFSDRNGPLRDRFINRLMFPIWSLYGKVIGFSGRQLPGDDFGPKYLNTPETALFHKSNSLFGLYQSRSDIRRNDLAILTEGQIDVISAHSIGIQNVIAPLGTALTENQLDAISRYSKNLLFFFDNDKAGQDALVRGFKMAVIKGFNVYAATSSEVKDLDELIQLSPERAREAINLHTDAYGYILSKMVEEVDLNDIREAKKVREFHDQVVESISDPLTANHFEKKFRKITMLKGSGKGAGTSADKDMATTVGTRINARAGTTSGHKGAVNIGEPENYLLLLLIKYENIIKLEKLNMREFKKEPSLEIIHAVQAQKYVDIESLLNHKELTSGTKEFLEELVMRQDEVPEDIDQNKSLNEAYIRVQKRNRLINLKLARRGLAIAEEQNDDIKMEKQMRKVQELTSQIKKLDEKHSRLRQTSL